MKPKILFHITSLDGGGAERMTRNIVLGLAQRGVDVSLAVLDASGPFAQSWPNDLAPLIDLKLSNPFQSIVALKRLFNEMRPEVVVTALHQPSCAAILASKKSETKPKVVVTLHSNVVKESTAQPNIRQRIMPHIVRRIYPKADKIVAVSKDSATVAIRFLGLDPSRVITIYNPVVNSNLEAQAKKLPENPKLLESDCTVLVGVGRLSAPKDFETALRALSFVKKLHNFHYLILGTGPMEASLRSLAKELGLEQNVIFGGFAANPFPYLKAARMLLMTSTYEGLPTVLIESLAVGTPVVFTDCPSGPVEILQPPKYGLCPKVGDPEDVAQAVIEELSKPKIAPPNESWAPFTEEASMKEYIRLLSEVAGRSVVD